MNHFYFTRSDYRVSHADTVAGLLLAFNIAGALALCLIWGVL